MSRIARIALITLVLTSFHTIGVAANSLVWDQLSVPNGRILSFSPDGRWLLAEFPLPPEGGSGGSTRAMLQDDDTREPKLCIYAAPSLVPRSCTAPGLYRGELGPRSIAGVVAWAPDGESLVFADGSLRTSVDGDLWKLNAATGELTNLTDDDFEGNIPFDLQRVEPIHLDLQPAFSPDGGSIVFSRATFSAGERAAPSVAILDLATGTVTTTAAIPTDPFHFIDGRILWAPDGSRVFFTTSGIDATVNALWSATIDGSTLDRITAPVTERGGEMFLHEIDPSGSRAIVVLPRSIQILRPPYFALVDLDTGETSPISSISTVDPAVYLYTPTFGRDGALLVIEEVRGDGGADDTVRLFSLDPTTGEPAMLADGLPNLAFNPVQSMPQALDGGIVVYPSARDRDVYAWTLVSLTGVNPVPATPASASGFAPGDSVRTTDATVIRVTPGSGGAIAAAVDAGTALVVIDAAVEIEGVVWQPVREPVSGALGYVPAALIVLES